MTFFTVLGPCQIELDFPGALPDLVTHPVCPISLLNGPFSSRNTAKK